MRIKIFLWSLLALLLIAGAGNAEQKTAIQKKTFSHVDEEIRKESPAVETTVVSKTFTLEYVRAEDIMPSVRKKLSADKGQAFYDAEKNTLTISDTPEYAENVSALIAELDKRVDISLLWRVECIRLNDEHGRGLDWEAIVSDYHPFDIFGEKTDSPPQELRLSVGTVTKEDFPVLLEALDAAGRHEEIINEKGMLTVNRMATQTLEFWENPKDSAQKRGFSLNVSITPELSGDNILSLQIVPQLAWYPLTIDEPLNPQITNFTASENLSVEVEEDEVLVIGGLVHFTQGELLSKVPIFGDLPLLGPFFRSQSPTTKGTEYIIFLVPGKFR